jgi:hypothetical protein
MATVEANVQPLEKELIIYEKGIPELLEVDTPFLELIEKQEADPVSNRAVRIPLLTQIGGTFQQVSMDGVALGATSGPIWNVATLTPFYFTGGYSWTALAQYATTGAERGVKSVTGEVMRLAIKQFRAYQDMLMNTSGNGVIGTITSLSTTTLTNDTLTLTTDGFKEELFAIGQNIQVYNAGLTTNRGGANVIAINRTAHTVQLDATIGSIAATDLVVIGGLSGTLTIQSSLFGVQYHDSDATSGLWLNLNRANISQIVTPSVNAASGALVTSFVRAALNRIRMNLGDDYFNKEDTKLIAYMHPAQADAYEALAITQSVIYKDPTGNQDVDLMFNNQRGLMMSNVPVRQSIHQDRTRIDFMNLGLWGRIVATDTGFYKSGDNIIWPQYASSGTQLVSTNMFYIKAGLQLYVRNPLGNSYVKNLALPAGSIY